MSDVINPPVRCRVRTDQKWADAGKSGLYYGKHEVNGMTWAVVLFDGDEDPTTYKAHALEVLDPRYIPLK